MKYSIFQIGLMFIILVIFDILIGSEDINLDIILVLLGLVLIFISHLKKK